VECQYTSPVQASADATGVGATRSDPAARQGLTPDEREAQEHLRELGLGGIWSCKRCPTKLW